MADSNAPRVKLPGAIIQKPVVPGPNSWAQQQQQRSIASHQAGDTRPTNRDRYEHKPMPPPPPPEDSASQGSYLLQPKAYIQPAIPLFHPPSNSQSQKNRAVTDPVAPKPLFAGRKISVSQLRKKYSQSKGKGDTSKEGSVNDGEPSPIIQIAPEKAVQVPELHPVPRNSRNTPPSSAPVAHTADHFGNSHEGSEGPAVTPARQAQSSPVPTRSTPVPTHRYLSENGLPGPAAAESSGAPPQQNTDSQRVPDEIEMGGECIPANRFLLPPRIGTHNNKGEVGLIEGSGMHRVESFRGVIEDGTMSNGSNGQAYVNSHAEASQPGTAPSQHTGDILPPNIYSPSDYDGVWENDPAVGHTLPPFTPMPRGHSANTNMSARHDLPYAPHHLGPDMNTNFSPHYDTNRFSTYRDPMRSANSWALNNSRGNSFASPTAPLSALPPPRWPHYQNTNSVPSPPQSQQDFQRAGSISASLAQIDLTLHHHIDSTFRTLSRMVIDRHDRMMDETIRRVENLEEILNKGFRELKNEAVDLKKHISNLQGDVNEVKKRENRTIELIKGMDGRLQDLKKHIDGNSCKCQQSATEQSGSEPESDRRHRSEATSHASHRRTESAHPTVGQGEPNQHSRSGASRTSNSARVSGTSSKRDRSNTVNSQQQPTSRMSDERSNKREYFAELGAARGPIPDIRDHPAFADRQHVHEQGYGYGGLGPNGMSTVLDRLPYENPNLSDGRWYQQAYGQHN